jgi:hypothetical protein
MELVLNNVDTESVRRETFQDREFIVAPVVPIQAMRLDGGYVPESHVAKSAPAWNGTPVTLNHPRDASGNLVSANSPDVAEKTWLGYLFNNRAVDDKMKGEIWIDVANAADDIVERIENGEPMSVSTSYFGDKLEPGVYDGAHREQVMGNIRPDHLALLPNKSGRCTIEDGCVAGPQANSLRFASAAASFNEATSNMERQEQIEHLVNEHGFEEESLDGMGDECLQQTYESFNESYDIDELADRLSDRFVTNDELAEAAEAVEEERRQRELAEDIVQNSDYEETDAVLDDFPTDVALETKHSDVTDEPSSANFAAQPAASAGSGSSTSMPALSANERLQELEE